VAPIREALRVLEQEGQLTYAPRKGYFVTELRIADLEEIYALRKVLEAEAVHHSLPHVDAGTIARMTGAARDCECASEAGDVLGNLEANRRFHFAVMEAPSRPHTLKIIRNLWDLTESYRALYYNMSFERNQSIAAHERIMRAVEDRNADRLISELDEHRDRALVVLRGVLTVDTR
jgi:DNA-binding GntR family transcriptional regulator